MSQWLHRVLVLVVILAIVRDGWRVALGHYLDALSLRLFGVPWTCADA